LRSISTRAVPPAISFASSPCSPRSAAASSTVRGSRTSTSTRTPFSWIADPSPPYPPLPQGARGRTRTGAVPAVLLPSPLVGATRNTASVAGSGVRGTVPLRSARLARQRAVARGQVLGQVVALEARDARRCEVLELAERRRRVDAHLGARALGRRR